MKKFEDLFFEPVIGYMNYRGMWSKIFFDNGYGISVIKHSGSYGYDQGLYECAVLKGNEEDSDLCYDTHITDDVIGWCDEEEVTRIMKQIQELKGVV